MIDTDFEHQRQQANQPTFQAAPAIIAGTWRKEIALSSFTGKPLVCGNLLERVFKERMKSIGLESPN